MSSTDCFAARFVRTDLRVRRDFCRDLVLRERERARLREALLDRVGVRRARDVVERFAVGRLMVVRRARDVPLARVRRVAPVRRVVVERDRARVDVRARELLRFDKFLIVFLLARVPARERRAAGRFDDVLRFDVVAIICISYIVSIFANCSVKVLNRCNT